MRLLVNDVLNQLGEVTFWHKLIDWFDLEFVGGDYKTLANKAEKHVDNASLIIRSVSYFPPIPASKHVPTIGFLQEILSGRNRALQNEVINSCTKVVANSVFTKSHYSAHPNIEVISIPIDFNLFNILGDEKVSDVCWVGASHGAEADVKGFDNFMKIVKESPQINFVAVLKDADISDKPANLQTFVKLPQTELAKVMNACRIGLCTSRVESQHLAGIEMGACGLPIVAPPVGIYWQRDDLPGALVADPDDYLKALNQVLNKTYDAQQISDYWHKQFNEEICHRKWTKLINKVELN